MRPPNVPEVLWEHPAGTKVERAFRRRYWWGEQVLGERCSKMNDLTTTHAHDEAKEILDALRQIQDNPELRAEAETNPESVLDRLKLSDISRHAVAFGIAGLLA